MFDTVDGHSTRVGVGSRMRGRSSSPNGAPGAWASKLRALCGRQWAVAHGVWTRTLICRKRGTACLSTPSHSLACWLTCVLEREINWDEPHLASHAQVAQLLAHRRPAPSRKDPQARCREAEISDPTLQERESADVRRIDALLGHDVPKENTELHVLRKCASRSQVTRQLSLAGGYRVASSRQSTGSPQSHNEAGFSGQSENGLGVPLAC